MASKYLISHVILNLAEKFFLHKEFQEAALDGFGFTLTSEMSSIIHEPLSYNVRMMTLYVSAKLFGLLQPDMSVKCNPLQVQSIILRQVVARKQAVIDISQRSH
jgi:hypothetical protein